MQLFAAADIELVPFVQLGCFGLLAALVFWSLWKGIPGLLAIHQTTMTSMATEHKNAIAEMLRTFEREAGECRTERMKTAAESAAEREKDRELRHELANKIQMMYDAKQDRTKN